MGELDDMPKTKKVPAAVSIDDFTVDELQRDYHFTYQESRYLFVSWVKVNASNGWQLRIAYINKDVPEEGLYVRSISDFCYKFRMTGNGLSDIPITCSFKSKVFNS